MLLKINPDNPGKKRVKTVVDVLKKDGVIILPTDSVYAIGCNMMSKEAIEKVCRLKGVKPEEANFSILCHDLSNLSEYIQNIEKPIFRILKNNLPGPFTFILKASSKVPKIFETKKKTIGIRVPDSNIARDIIRQLGSPLVVTSLHDDKDELLEYLTDPELIHERFEKRVDIVVDGGFGDNNPSTVVDFTNNEPHIIREGKGELLG